MRRAFSSMIVAAWSSLLWVPGAQSANCILRNPDRQIYQLFPEATSYRTIIDFVGPEKREELEQASRTSLFLHDLGRQTVCIVMKDGFPIGFVHARSDLGERGTVELIWAFDLDLRIRDFLVQRTRERHADVIKGEGFRLRLQGRRGSDLSDILADGLDPGELKSLSLSEEASQLGRLALMSGIKTAVILQLGLSDNIAPARLLGRMKEHFPAMIEATRVSAVFGESSTSLSPFFDPNASLCLRARDENEATLGYLIYGYRKEKDRYVELWSIVTEAGIIRDIWSNTLIGDEIAGETSGFRDKSLRALPASSSSANPLERGIHEFFSRVTLPE